MMFDINDTLISQQYKRIPSYYTTMYKDGFTPYEILVAARKQMYK